MFIAKRLELLGLEIRPGDVGVILELVGEGLVLGGDLEVPAPVQVRVHRAIGRRTEYRPAQVRLDQPREMIVQRRDLGVGAGVREIDRSPHSVRAQGLAGIEIPAEERVDDHGHLRQGCHVLGNQEVVPVHPVSVVQWRRRVIVNVTELRAETDATHEQVERLHALLQMHDARTAPVIGLVQTVFVANGGDTDPGPAVVGLHE